MARGTTRHLHPLARMLTVLGLAAGTMAAPGHAAAAKSGSLRIGGHVPAQVALRLSDWTLTPVAIRASGGAGRVSVAGLRVLANNRQFSVRLRSLGAIIAGSPVLIDPATGGRLPYAITYGGSMLELIGGEVVLDRLLSTTGPAELEVSLPAAARPGAGRFQDRLVLEIAAR